MTNVTKAIFAQAAGIFALAISGCASSPSGVSSKSGLAGEFEGAPAWVTSGRCEDPPIVNPRDTFCGVANHRILSANRIHTATQAGYRKAASQIALTVSARVTINLKGYEDEKLVEGVEGGAKADFRASAEQASQMIADHGFQGMEQQAKWISPSDNIYVLVALDAAKVSKQLQALMESEEAVKMLDPAVREAIRKDQNALLDEAKASKASK